MIASVSQLASPYTSAISRSNAVAEKSSEPIPPGVPRGRNPAVSAEDMALSYAGLAESHIAAINQSMARYDYYKSDEYKQAVSGERFLAFAQRMREGMGSEAAERIISHLSPEGMMEHERKTMAEMNQHLSVHFNVSGSLYTYDSGADKFSPGEFSLSLNAGYFGVKVDGKGGIQISTNGGAFTDKFVRNDFSDAGFLPRQSLRRRLFDIVA